MSVMAVARLVLPMANTCQSINQSINNSNNNNSDNNNNIFIQDNPVSVTSTRIKGGPVIKNT